jgi:DNA-binding response OmpR family regulator
MYQQEPKKILVVEDEGAMRDIVAHKLQTHGFLVAQAADGKEGLEVFTKEKPDLVLLDLMLPEVDGFTVLENIRKNPDAKLAETPVVILSNIWNDKDILRVRELKVSDYMIKAYFTTEEILNTVNKILHLD